VKEMIETKNKRAYYEVYIILKELELLDKLPIEIKEILTSNVVNSYKFSFNREIPLYEQIENEETKVLISYLYLKYINKNIEEKNILLEKYKQNEKVYQKEIQEKYNTDNLFENKKTQEIEIKEETQALVEYKEKTFVQKFLDKIKNFLKDLLRKDEKKY